MMRCLALLALVSALFAGCSTSPKCTQVQCVRAVMCRTSCTQPATSNGCCPCEAGSFDDVGICLPDGGLADGGR